MSVNRYRQVSRLPALVVILRNHNLRLVKTGRVFRRGQPGQTFEVMLVFIDLLSNTIEEFDPGSD
jgi:hypothetical protein